MTADATVRLWVGVDNGRCSGHARCNAAAPDVFTLDEEGYSDIGSEHPVAPGREDAAISGIPTCPELALAVVRDDRDQP